jgi:SAM-dependent methyltransferase
MRAVDIGGSLTGMQFVLDKMGLSVVNVDPGEAAPMGWPVDARTFKALNRAFRTHVELRRAFLEQAGIEDASVDRVFCISTLEHVPDDGIESILREVRRILRPGGQCVLTVDLFLDLAPFTDRVTNASGRNVDLSWLVQTSGLTLTTGDERELCGFPGFDPNRVQSELGDLLYATHVPALTQALVLTRPTS